MYPNPSESSVADDIAHNLASQEIIGVGEKQIKIRTFLSLEQLHFQNEACMKRSVFPMLIKLNLVIRGKWSQEHRCYFMIIAYNHEVAYCHRRMWVGNVFSHVCLCVCMSVQVVTFEPLHTETSFFGIQYIFTISWSTLSIKVIGLRARSYEKNDDFTYSAY